MKDKVKSIILLFVISLVLIPCFIYGISANRTQPTNKEEGKAKILSYIVATPKELRLPRGSDEKCFRSKIKVEAHYKKASEPVVVTEYDTDYEKKVTGKEDDAKVTIQYTECGCTKKATIYITFCEGEEISPKPTETPSETPMVTPGTSSEDADINFPYISGYPDETFRPNQPVTREELATMMARLITKNRIPTEANQFKDVLPNRFSTDAINYITKLGIMKPVSKDEFDPNGTVSYREFQEIVANLAPYIKDDKVKLPTGNGDLTRVQAVTAFNQLFKVQCNTAVQGVPFKDITESTPNYDDIICATQPRIEPRS